MPTSHLGDLPPEPLGSEAEFAALIEEMVAANAPRLFAVVQEYGVRADGRLAAWGLAFDDHVDVLDTEGPWRMRFQSVDRAVSAYARQPDISTRVVWRASCTDGDGRLLELVTPVIPDHRP